MRNVADDHKIKEVRNEKRRIAREARRIQEELANLNAIPQQQPGI